MSSCRCCSGVCWMIALCAVQLLFVAFQQTISFLGLQWTEVAMNFCQIAAVILAIFGCTRSKPRLLAMYSAWLLIWIGWNLYLIFLYVGVGVLNLNQHMVTLNLGLSESFPWFVEKCTIFTVMEEETATAFDLAGISSENFPWYCAIGYQYIAVGQSALQIFLSVFGFAMSCYVIGVMREEEDSFDFIGGFGENDSRKQKRGTNSNAAQTQPLVGAASGSSNA